MLPSSGIHSQQSKQMRLALPFLFALLPLLVSCTNLLPVRLTDQVEAMSVEDLAERASEPVTGEGIYPATLIDEKTDETNQVNNATDLYRLMGRGYVPRSGIDETMALNITNRVGAYRLIRDLEPSRETYVRGLRFDDPDILEWFPFVFHSLFSSGYREADQAILSGEHQRLDKPYNPDLQLVEGEETEVVFLNGEPGWEFRVWVAVHAFGDWNGDGVEDMVLEVTQRAEHGTLRDRYYTVVTRDKDLRWDVLAEVEDL